MGLMCKLVSRKLSVYLCFPSYTSEPPHPPIPVKGTCQCNLSLWRICMKTRLPCTYLCPDHAGRPSAANLLSGRPQREATHDIGPPVHPQTTSQGLSTITWQSPVSVHLRGGQKHFLEERGAVMPDWGALSYQSGSLSHSRDSLFFFFFLFFGRKSCLGHASHPTHAHTHTHTHTHKTSNTPLHRIHYQRAPGTRR